MTTEYPIMQTPPPMPMDSALNTMDSTNITAIHSARPAARETDHFGLSSSMPSCAQ